MVGRLGAGSRVIGARGAMGACWTGWVPGGSVARATTVELPGWNEARPRRSIAVGNDFKVLRAMRVLSAQGAGELSGRGFRRLRKAKGHVMQSVASSSVSGGAVCVGLRRVGRSGPG